MKQYTSEDMIAIMAFRELYVNGVQLQTILDAYDNYKERYGTPQLENNALKRYSRTDVVYNKVDDTLDKIKLSTFSTCASMIRREELKNRQ